MSDDSNTQVYQTSARKDKHLPIGEKLVKAGLITYAQLEMGLKEQKRLGLQLGETLCSLGFVSYDAIAKVQGEATDARFVQIKNLIVPPKILALVPHEMAKRYKLIPIHATSKTITLVMADTLNVIAIDAIEKRTKLSVIISTASAVDIYDAIERNYTQAGNIEEIIDKTINKRTSSSELAIDEDAPMIQLVDKILTLALQRHATDIHIEPDERVIRVRMRLDGVMTQQALIPKDLQDALTARVKIVADLNVTEKRIPQDGRSTFNIGLQKVDLRVSTLPTVFGENMVIRVLDKSNLSLKLKDLGLYGADRERFEKSMHRTSGIVLVTGPTGSGKTSTLYAALSMINTLELSVYTLEDPVEYQLPIIRQTHINAEVGMTFTSGLRALLRQDPDVIMVGEIRDPESAELSIRSAMTGHLVLSTLHTNDAIGAIARLTDMGIEPFLLTSSLAAVVGQRLIRRICKYCAAEVKDPELLIASLGKINDLDSIKGAKLWEGKGCPRCSGSGYSGRIGIYEVLAITDAVRDAIVHRKSSTEIKRIARESGFTTMVEDGLSKAFEGITTVKEIMRVIG